jgi:hypothetical protein
MRADLGPAWLGMLGLVWLASMVGSALGPVLASTLRTATLFLPAVALALLLMVLGGPARPLPTLNTPGRFLASAMPTRWAFEGLLLLSANPATDDLGVDPIEPFFRAETDRMGVFACTSALIAMLLGLVYAAIVIASERASPHAH